LRDAGFQIRSRKVLTLFTPDDDANSSSAQQMDVIADCAVGRRALSHVDLDDWTTDRRQRGQEGRYFCRLNRSLVLVGKPTRPEGVLTS
jgi:hypothetical protein